MSANDRQVGGAHYGLTTVQHWDVVEQLGVGYLEGCATKYVLRHRTKGGITDIDKAIHYVEKLLELSTAAGRGPRSRGLLPSGHTILSGIKADERIVVRLLMGHWSGYDLSYCLSLLQKIRRECYPLSAEIHPGTPEDGGQHARQDDDVLTPEEILRLRALMDISAAEIARRIKDQSIRGLLREQERLR